jgi:hypothetical protein
MGSELARRRLGRLTDEIVALRGKMGRDLFEIGRRLVEVHEGSLWESGGVGSFEDYLERAVDLSRTTAYRFMRVAQHFNREFAYRYGPVKLDAGLRLLRATAADERPGDVLASKVTVQDGGRFRALSFHEASAKQIIEAARIVEARKRGRQRPRGVAKLRDELEAMLPDAPEGTARGRRVRLSQGRDGRVAVSFAALPLDDLEAFAKALLAMARASKKK